MGIAIVMVASIIFGVVPSLQNLVLAHGASPLALVVCCNGIASLTGLAVALARHESLRIDARQLRDFALIGVFGLFLTDYLLDVAYTLIPVGFVTMIHFTYPSLVCLGSALLFKQRAGRNKTLAVIASISGLLLLGGGSFSGSALGLAVAFATSVTYAYYMVANGHSSVSGLPSSVFIFYVNIFVVAAALVLGVSGVTGEGLILPASPMDWAFSAIVGVAFGVALMLLNAGVERLGAGTASFVNMVEPVTSLAVSAIAYRYALNPAALAGCALICSALVLAALPDGHPAKRIAGRTAAHGGEYAQKAGARGIAAI